MWGGPRVELTHAGPLRARGPIPAAMTTYNRLYGSIRHLISFRALRARLLAVPEVTVSSCREGDDRVVVYRPPGGLGTHRRKSVADAQVWMRATQFIILSPLGQRLGILAVAWVDKLS
ncbi:hypothetical protein CYMTET_35154 [Cymbomonas tetramitiformis]|uniref:Uncharacterized protein n=1 Tax=Cymbomonas tetramitiformis TaxID=36881 RepID=A0AAE0KPH1_9CHLO|nr:hypothetical protein CYMTET_35154 [Cymbomonas tetramitiformis]